MNATPNPRRRRKTGDIAPVPFSELPLSGANTEDEFGRSCPPVEHDATSAPTAAAPLTAEPSALEGSEPVTAGAEPSTALTVVGDVHAAMRSVQTRADIATLLDTAKAITAITNADGRQQAHSLLMSLVRVRTGVDTLYEEVSTSVRSFMDDLRGERDGLKKLSAVEEARIRKLRDDWDEAIEHQKQLAAEAEAARVRNIQDSIELIRSLPVMAVGMSSGELETAIKNTVAMEIGEEFAEFRETAATVRDMSLDKLRAMRQAALDAEENARKVAEQEEANRVERARIAEDNRVAESARQRRQLADDEIRSIAQILTNADRRGTLEAFDEAIRIGAAWVIDDSRFFGHVASVSDALNDVRALLVERRATLVKKLADEATAKAMAEARERAMEAIRGIQERLHLAAEGDSLEAYDLAISCTEGEAITEDRFGAMVSTATIVKTNTLATLRQRRETVAKRLATAAELEEKRLAQEAEEKRQADQRAELARQEEALRLQQETMAKPSDPVEALPGEAVKMLLAIGNEVCKDAADRVESEKKPRPSDEAIVEVLMRAFSEDRATIVDWLCDLDLMALAEDEEPDFSEVALA